MNNIFITYSLIKSIYESGGDYLDVFVPFLLTSFPENGQEMPIETLNKNIKDKYGLEIPQHTLDSIITRAVRTNLIDRDHNKCILTKNGQRIKLEINTKKLEEERQINALIEDMRKYLNETYSVILDVTAIREMLLSFIGKFRLPLINFFNTTETEYKEDENYSKKEELYVADYFKIANKQKPDFFETLKQIYYGAFISTVLYKENIPEINKKFNPIKIYLDSNMLFSIMGLHHRYICDPIQELFNLLRRFKNFQLLAFDFTINEMVSLLKGYEKESQRYSPYIKVNSIYSNLKKIGWTREDCIRFISKIEQKINGLGVQIELTGLDIEKDCIKDKDRYSKIDQYKPDQSLFGKRHDIYAIKKIREIRKRPQREIENCIAIFLTSDLKLAKFDFMELGHREKSTVCEVISDRFLTTFLWLKNPKAVKELPIEMILSTQSEILVDRRVWNRFYENLIQVKKDGEISDDDISTLMYYHQIEQDLALVSDPNDITKTFILEKIDESIKGTTEDTKRKIAQEKKKVEEKYSEEMAKKDGEFLKKIEGIKSKIRLRAKKKATILSILIFIMPIFLLILGIIIFRPFNVFIGTIVGILSLLSLLGISINLFNMKKKIYDFVLNRTYNKQISDLDLEQMPK